MNTKKLVVKDEKGILIFAFNNSQVDYFKHASWVADRVNKFLNLPVSIVTDEESVNGRKVKHNLITGVKESGGTRNYNHKTTNETDTWFNASRYTAYSLSPYEQTIVIDSDYIVNSDMLLKVFDCGYDVICPRSAYDMTGLDRFRHYYTFGRHNFPHYWATILYFRKSDFAKDFFDVLSMIRKNYRHYSYIHKFNSRIFRNDFAVSMALSIVYGHNLDAIPSIPWSIPTIFDDVNLIQRNEDTFEIYFDKEVNQRVKPFKTLAKRSDIHCINKTALENVVNG